MAPLAHRALAYTTIFALGPALFLLDLRGSIATSYRHPIQISNSIPSSLAKSHLLVAIVNPDSHIAMTNTHSTLLPVSCLPTTHSGEMPTDKELLARFTRGFFGGQVFAVERSALCALGYVFGKQRLLQVGGLRGRMPSGGAEVWSAAEIREIQEWNVGMKVAGAFQIASTGVASDDEWSEDRSILARPVEEGGTSPQESHVDFVYGWDGGILRGVHRFSVLRHGPEDGEGRKSQLCELRFASVACNPTANQPLNALLGKLHRVYALLLFRNAVAEVLAPSG